MTAKVNVVSLIETLHIGGDENRLLTLARHIDRDRFRHRVILMSPPSPESESQLGPILGAYRDCDIRVDVVPGISADRRRNSTGALRDGAGLIGKLSRLLRDDKVDILDTRKHFSIAVGVAAGRLARVPVIVGTEYFHQVLKGKGMSRYLLGQSSLSGLDALISDSQDAIDGYQGWLLRRHPRAVVIPNGIPFPQADKHRAEMRAWFGLPADPSIRVIGQISRLMPYKGQRILLQAAAPLLAKYPDVYLLICGYAETPAYVRELEQLALDLGIGERVRMAGYPGRVGDVWTAIDIHAHPTLFDSSPLAIHESMALGLPAVVSDEGGIPELVADGVTGLIVPKGDVEACTAALDRLLRSPDLCARLGYAARQRYVERHRPETMVRATEALFDALLSGKRRKSA
jgi:glycosyltransferase involved in cell wall biosynthesis